MMVLTCAWVCLCVGGCVSVWLMAPGGHHNVVWFGGVMMVIMCAVGVSVFWLVIK